MRGPGLGQRPDLTLYCVGFSLIRRHRFQKRCPQRVGFGVGHKARCSGTGTAPCFLQGPGPSGLKPTVWAVITPASRDHSQREERAGTGAQPRQSALLRLPWSPQQGRTATARSQGRQEEPIIFLFPPQPVPWGRAGRGREAGERPPEAAFQRNYPCTG